MHSEQKGVFKRQGNKKGGKKKKKKGKKKDDDSDEDSEDTESTEKDVAHGWVTGKVPKICLACLH